MIRSFEMHKTLIFFWLSEHQRKHYIHLSFFNFISLLLEHNQITCAQISVPIYSLDKLILVTGSQSQSADLTLQISYKTTVWWAQTLDILPSDFDSIQSEFYANNTVPFAFICHTCSSNNECVSVQVCSRWIWSRWTESLVVCDLSSVWCPDFPL